MTKTPRQTLQLDASPDAVAQAATCLRAGGLVAFATETVYGLGADASNAQAVAALYEAKGRPAVNPLIAHLPTREAALNHGRFNDAALKLAEAFWPGPLTLVVPVVDHGGVCALARAGLASVGLRVPSHPLAQAILSAAGVPVVAPSANLSGHVSPTIAAHVADDLRGRIDMIIDGGATPIGVESTIIACLDEPVLLRPGRISRKEIEAVLGFVLEVPHSTTGLLAPGMMQSHYAPKAQLRLNATSVGHNEVLLAFGPVPAAMAGARLIYNLSPNGDVDEAANALFAALRALDDAGAASIAVMPVPVTGIGEAINDRLARAAAPK